jgi:hypothetical protein
VLEQSTEYVHVQHMEESVMAVLLGNKNIPPSSIDVTNALNVLNVLNA